ncbi:MAG: hypothetical protein WBO19_21190 [Terriglobia bacterium]
MLSYSGDHMRSELQEFLRETELRFPAAKRDWRKALFPELSGREWVDAAVLAGESVPGLIQGIRAGFVTDAHFDPDVIESFHLQYPNVRMSFTDFVQQHQDPDELRGVISGVKGKLFELRHVTNLNEHLPDGYVARLAGSATQPGYDIIIEGPDHHYDYLQDKFSNSLSLLRRAADRWPDIDIALPHEIATQVTDPDLIVHVVDTGISGDALNAKIEHTVDAASADIGFHFPWLLLVIIAADEAHQVWKRKAKLMHFWKRFKQRSKQSLGSNFIGQGIAVAAGEPALQLVSVPVRLLRGRYDVAAYWMKLIDARRQRIAKMSQALESGPDGRERVKSLARMSLLLNSRRA